MKVGSRVLCVNASIKADTFFGVIQNFKNWVEKDKIYTVREILDNDDIVPGILLEEISNPPVFIKLLGRTQEPAFAAFRFRELEDDKVKELEEELEEVNVLDEILAL
jgi:hypothetical protein